MEIIHPAAKNLGDFIGIFKKYFQKPQIKINFTVLYVFNQFTFN